MRSAQGRLNDAEREFQRALAIYRSAFGDMHSGVAQCLNSLAGIASERRRDQEARRLYARALEVRKAVLVS